MDKIETNNKRIPEKDTETERHFSEIFALSQVSAALSDLSDLNAILKVALDNVLSIMNGAIGGILLLDKQTQTLSYVVYRGLSSECVERVHLKLGEGIAGTVAQGGKALLLEDISMNPREAEHDLMSNESLKAFICVPLRARGNVLGVLTVASHMPRKFTDNDMYLLLAIGDQLGIAIEHASLYERLIKARERLRKLARQNLVAEEQERRRIALELHDETSQSLSGLALQLQVLIEMSTLSAKHDAEFIAKLKKVQSLTVQVHTEVSRLISNLHPALLDTLGLVFAVRHYAKSMLQPLEMNVSVKIKGAERRFAPDVEVALFRVIQGSISNIAQHSKAKHATIVLEYHPDEFILKVKDDGQGFDVSKITDVEESGRGRGLFSMRERIGLLGGTGRIDSKIGAGTIVWAKIPIGQEIAYAENKSTDS